MMLPEEDPTWPECLHHGVTPDHSQTPPTPVGEHHWCDWTRDYLVRGQDGQNIGAGQRVLVPIVPVSYHLYAEVATDTDLIAGMMCKLYLVLDDPTAFGADTERLVPLGLHTTGEGRLVIASTLWAWIESEAKERCTCHLHSYKQEMMLTHGKDNADFQRANQACMAMFDRCLPCWMEGRTIAPPSGDFGMGGVGNPSSASQSTLQQLTNQFGKP